jgi:tripartite-type tricarboxylate transporter receptor subunit TctC
MNRRRALGSILGLGVCLATGRTVGAREYPIRPIHIVVPWPAGGIVDTRVRVLADRLGKALGQSVIVENKPGASGTLGAQFVAHAAPNGYTLLAGSFVDQAVALNLFHQLTYDPRRDFVPIVCIGRGCLVLFVHESLNVSTLDQFLSLARARPLQYASGGIGTPQHLLMERLKMLAGVELTPVHYKGGAPALQDVVAGHVPVMFEFGPTSFPHAQAGKIKPLVTGCNRRLADLYPEVPSAEEAGFPRLELVGWGGFFAPKGTASEVVQLLNREVIRIMGAPDVRGHLAMKGSDYPQWSPEQFAEFIEGDRPRWAEVMRVAHIEPQ